MLQFHSDPSRHLWTDDNGDTHVIHQGERGQQGDACMPMLHTVGRDAGLGQFVIPDGMWLCALGQLTVSG